MRPRLRPRSTQNTIPLLEKATNRIRPHSERIHIPEDPFLVIQILRSCVGESCSRSGVNQIATSPVALFIRLRRKFECPLRSLASFVCQSILYPCRTGKYVLACTHLVQTPSAGWTCLSPAQRLVLQLVINALKLLKFLEC